MLSIVDTLVSSRLRQLAEELSEQRCQCASDAAGGYKRFRCISRWQPAHRLVWRSAGHVPVRFKTAPENLSRRQCAIRPGVVATARNLKCSAHNGNQIFESHRLHDRVLGSDSCAKYAAAFFTISRSMRVSASSLRHYLQFGGDAASWRRCGCCPASRGTHQLGQLFFGMVIRAAVSSSVNSCVRTSLTASSLSSDAYVFVRFISFRVGEVYQTGVSEKIRVSR